MPRGLRVFLHRSDNAVSMADGKGRKMNLEESASFLLVNQDRLAERFYERLFSEHPETRQFFAGIDMAHQQSKLVSALVTVQRHATVGGWVSENYLRGLGKKHVALKVTPEMFPHFESVLIKVLAELHEINWSNFLAVAWQDAIRASVKIMLSEYPAE